MSKGDTLLLALSSMATIAGCLPPAKASCFDDWAKTQREYRGRNFQAIRWEAYGSGRRIVVKVPRSGPLGSQGGVGFPYGLNFLEAIEQYRERAQVLGCEVDRAAGMLKHPDPETLARIANDLRKNRHPLAPSMGIAVYSQAGEVPRDLFFSNLRRGVLTLSSHDMEFAMHDLHAHLFAAILLPREAMEPFFAQAGLLYDILHHPTLSRNARLAQAAQEWVKKRVDRWDGGSFGFTNAATYDDLPRAIRVMSTTLQRFANDPDDLLKTLETLYLPSLPETDRAALKSMIDGARRPPLPEGRLRELARQVLALRRRP